MTALTPNVPSHEGLDRLASRYVEVDALSWQPTKFQGVHFKTLLIDPDTGMLTSLVRMAPGSVLPDHEHIPVSYTHLRGPRD